MKKYNVDSRITNRIGNTGCLRHQVSVDRRNLHVRIDIGLLRLHCARRIKEPGTSPFCRENGGLDSLFLETRHEHFEVPRRGMRRREGSDNMGDTFYLAGYRSTMSNRRLR